VTSTSSPAELSAATAAICTVFIFLIPFAGAGLALINTGLGRSRSAAHCMMSALCAISVAALVYFVCGFAWQGFAGQPAHVVTVGGSAWDWIGAGPFLFRHLPLDGSPVSLAALLGMFSVGLAALIPTGSGCDRWRLGACCASTALLAGWTFPLFAHWVWGGGWLAQLGAKYGMGYGFLDAGGSGTIQVTGGLTALAIAWIIGPRHGKYAKDGMPIAIPGHNVVLVVLGCALALVGWLGLNSAGAILFYGVAPERVVGIALNTMIAATSAAVAAAVITNARFGKPDTSLSANGWIGGLAASSAAAAFIVPAEAAIIGLVAGSLVTLSVEWFELRMSVDDPGGAISAHGVGGLWGLLAAGFFASVPAQTVNAAVDSGARGSGQWLAQVAGIATLIGFVLPLTYGLNLLLNRFYPQRVAPEGERQGMDLYELGAGAYPEFLTHSEEFTQRKL
jgi:ammonium transporter, Amt family